MMPDELLKAAWELGPWALAIIAIIWAKWDDIKQAVTKLYSDRYADRADRREDAQTTQRTVLDFKLQERATQQSREWMAQQTALDIVREQNQWAQNEFVVLSNDVQAMKNQLPQLFGVLSEIRDDIREIKQRDKRNH